MSFRDLRTRFILAGVLLVTTTLVSNLWSTVTFARLSAAADNALREGREKIDLTAEFTGSLEREEDALLLALSGDPDAAQWRLNTEQERGEAQCVRLLGLLRNGDEAGQQAAKDLRVDVDAFRAAGSEMFGVLDKPDALKRYVQRVNPLLRRATAVCARIREASVQMLRQAGISARDEAAQATWIVACVSAAGIALAIMVSIWLARSVLLPVRDLTDSVEALRLGDFDRRVSYGVGSASVQELAQLGAGFNRMAETLAAYRRSSLGELLTAKMTLEATLNALPDAVLVVAPDGGLAALNPPAQAVLASLHADEAQRLQDLPLRADHREAVDTALAGRPSVPNRTDFARALTTLIDGQPRRFLVTAVPIPEFAPRQFGAVVVFDDVTDFARLDELRGELIGVASHELKSPLTTLRMNLLLLGEETGGLSPRQREMLKSALLGCEELGGTIDELLDVTRVEAGQLRLDLAPVDLNGILDQVLHSLRGRFDDAGVRVRVIRNIEQAMIRADAGRVRNVLTNVLTNALKYSPEGSTVAMHLLAGPNGNGRQQAPVEIAVVDEGPGVPPEFRQRVFEKFFRVEHYRGSGPKNVRGTGIGLYLCREIVRAHGGSIRCEAGEGGHGTRVAITLPPAEGQTATPFD